MTKYYYKNKNLRGLKVIHDINPRKNHIEIAEFKNGDVVVVCGKVAVQYDPLSWIELKNSSNVTREPLPTFREVFNILLFPDLIVNNYN